MQGNNNNNKKSFIVIVNTATMFCLPQNVALILSELKEWLLFVYVYMQL